MVPIRLAIVGCGTVAEGYYAPALRGFQGFSSVVMVDRQLHRAEILKSYFQSCAAETDFTARQPSAPSYQLSIAFRMR
jgi:predicted dehydrogenase